MDREVVRAFMERFMDMTTHAALLGVVGAADRAGLFRALQGAGALPLEAIAARSGLDPRYLREALAALAAGGFLRFDPDAATYALPDEHAVCLADESSPWCLVGWTQILGALYRAVPAVSRAFREGGGVSYEQFGEDMVEGIDRANGPGTRILLTRRWLPAMPQMVETLERGGRVADVGCGSGTAALALAQAFPRSVVTGYDVDLRSIERARAAASETGLANVRFERVAAESLPTRPGFDLVLAFDVIHDLVNPRAALRRIRLSLRPAGSFLLVEPAAGDSLEENLDAHGALLYALSTLHCTTVSLAHGGEGLGAAWGPKRAEALCRQAGFTRFRRLAIENPFHAFYEVAA